MSADNLHFCQECNNLLYPKEDRPRKVLMYACRTCPYAVEADNPCVYRRQIKLGTKESAGTTQDLHTDPTLPRSHGMTCPRCSRKGAVFYQDQSKRTETSMTLFYVCLHCHRPFRDPKIDQRRNAENLDLENVDMDMEMDMQDFDNHVAI